MSRIAAFADELLRAMLTHRPDLAVELGIDAVGETALPKSSLPDLSDAGVAARRALMAAAHADLARIERPHDPEDALTYDVASYVLDEGLFGPFSGLAGHRFPEEPYPLNHLNGAQVELVLMLARAPLADEEQCEALVARMAGLPQALAGAADAAHARAAEGFPIPRESAARAHSALRALWDAWPDNPIIANARQCLGAGGGAWLARIETALAEVQPAFRAVAEAIRAAADVRDAGLCATPDGEAHYAWRLRAHTTTDLTPQEIHEAGLRETQRVRQDIEERLSALGAHGATLGERLSSARGERRFSADRSEVMRQAGALMADIEARVRPMFQLSPHSGVAAVPLPEAFENSRHHAYTPPSAKGARGGVFSINVGALLNAARAPLVVLAAHEAIPGHHTQLALAQELAGLCAFRRALIFNAYIEGWAKYAETLLDEIYPDDPDIRIARLQGELYSSTNLTLDTGLHAMGWSRAKAIGYFSEQTGADAHFAAAIVDRSLVTPGQLCAYKIGMRTMLGLREARRKRLGAAFDIRAFHDSVLQQGALPLRLLERVVLEERA